MQTPVEAIPKTITVAGSDSGAGAGIQADLKTFAALGVYGSSVLTAVTAQNTMGVFAVAEVPEEIVIAQIDLVLHDIGAQSAKTGMLSNPRIIASVADRLEAWGIDKLVVDPVMVAKSGDQLLQAGAIDSLKEHLLPLALIVTPNIPEAETLTGRTLTSDDDLHEAAREIHAMGPKIVVIKGGHREAGPTDLIFDGSGFEHLPGERIETRNNHGTGCTFSAAIAAELAKGTEPMPAIAAAKQYITDALRASYAIGEGHSPVNHFFAWPAHRFGQVELQRKETPWKT